MFAQIIQRQATKGGLPVSQHIVAGEESRHLTRQLGETELGARPFDLAKIDFIVIDRDNIHFVEPLPIPPRSDLREAMAVHQRLQETLLQSMP